MIIVDVKKQIKDSNSKFLRNLPVFMINILAKIAYQDELNRIVTKYSDDIGVDFLPKVLEEMNIKIQVEGLENLPDNGRCFFVANHPFGIVDGLVLTSIVSGKYGNFRAIGNDVFMLIPQLRPLIAAVNVFGTNKRDYLMELDRVFQSDVPITHFPAGLVSRLHNFKVLDSVWQKSFITKTMECNRVIVPLYFYGRNSILFYSVYLIRKTIGIKATVELALLPHEFFNKKNRTIRVRIGKPITYKDFNKSQRPSDTAQWVKSKVYNLRHCS